MISDATWRTLAKRLDERQLIELPIVVGQYQTVAYYQNSLRLRLHTGNLGLMARKRHRSRSIIPVRGLRP
jgi:hypothetical protein